MAIVVAVVFLQFLLVCLFSLSAPIPSPHILSVPSHRMPELRSPFPLAQCPSRECHRSSGRATCRVAWGGLGSMLDGQDTVVLTWETQSWGCQWSCAGPRRWSSGCWESQTWTHCRLWRKAFSSPLHSSPAALQKVSSETDLQSSQTKWKLYPAGSHS